MYTEKEKYTFMRNLVSEKYQELRKAISTISISQTDKTRNNAMINSVIRSIFLTDATEKEFKEKRINWLDNISTVDLLHVYHTLNCVLNCFYNRLNVKVIVNGKQPNGDVGVEDYTLHKNDWTTQKNMSIFFDFRDTVENNKKKFVDSYFIKSTKTRKGTQQFADYKSLRVALPIKSFSKQYREDVISYIVEDAVARYSEVKGTYEDYFENACSHFCLASKPEINHIDPRATYMETIGFRNATPIGLDANGNVVVEDSYGQRYNSHNQKVDDDYYVDFGGHTR